MKGSPVVKAAQHMVCLYMIIGFSTYNHRWSLLCCEEFLPGTWVFLKGCAPHAWFVHISSLPST